MTDYTVEEFCDFHNAYSEGRKWAMKNCTSMNDVWKTIRPDWLVWTATRPGVLTDNELRLFAVFCARQVQHMMTDPRSIAAIDAAERFAHGEAPAEELSAARAASVAAWAAKSTASDAAECAAWAAASATNSVAARDAQSAWLRANTKPNFSKPEVKNDLP